MIQRKNLLETFWQRSSDACPLEASEMERQVADFEKFVNDLDQQSNDLLEDKEN